MSDGATATTPASGGAEENVRQGPSGWATVAGIALVFGIVVAVNIVAGMLNWRADLTEDKIYTLSDGTKNILSKLDTPVTIRYYVSADKSLMPTDVRNMAPRVENFLMEYKKLSRGQITVKKIEVKADSDEEDSANQNGIQPQGFLSQEPLYFGIAVQCLEQNVAIPFIHPARETLLEYDLSRSITLVVNPERPKVAVLSSLQVAGGFSGGMMNMQQGPAQPWFLYRELSREFEMETLGMDVTEIPADVDVLVVVHPFDITSDAELAIDQYLLAGGRIVALLDPMFFHSRVLSPPQQQQNPMMPPQQAPGQIGPVSTFSALLDAWGVQFDANKVLLDNEFRSPVGRGVVHPGVLTITEEGFVDEDVTTAQLQDIRMAFAGTFSGEGAPGLTRDVLIASSPESAFVTAAEAELGPGVQRLLDEFTASGERHAIAIRLHGDFKSAYAPKDEDDEKKPAEVMVPSGEGSAEVEVKTTPAPEPKTEPKAEPKAEPKGEGEGEGEGDAKPAPEKPRPAAADTAPEPKEKKSAPPKDAKPDAGDEKKKPAKEKAKPKETGGEGQDDGAAEGESAEGDAAPARLTKSTKPGTVVLFGDADFVYDQMVMQEQNILGQRVLIPLNQNLSLLQNIIEQLAGDPDLVEVRSRASTRRPFTKINEIEANAEAEFQGKIAELEADVQGTQERLSLLQGQKDPSQQFIVNEAQQKEIQELEDRVRQKNKDLREVRKNLRQDIDSLISRLKFVNILSMPVLVIVAGVILALGRRARRAAR